MSRPEEPILFEAICTPPRGLSRAGLLLVGMLVGLASAAVGLIFTLMGAWPVLGFVGGEALLVVALLVAYRRWAGRTSELVLLTERELLVRRRGDANAGDVRLAPYWTRLRLEERPGRVSGLWLSQHRQQVEIGRHLSEEEKRDLAAALGEALRRYREPVFHNPQLMDC